MVGFRNKQGRVEHRYYSTKSRAKVVIHIQQNSEMVVDIAGMPVHMDQDIISLWFSKKFFSKNRYDFA